MNELKIKDYLIPVLVAMVILRIYMIMIDVTEYGAGYYYMFRQTIYTAAWASLIWFMSEVTLQRTSTLNKSKINRMKKASFCAMIACLLKFAITLFLQIQIQFDLPALKLTYTIIELLAWLMLTIFFYCFWTKKKKQEKHIAAN